MKAQTIISAEPMAAIMAPAPISKKTETCLSASTMLEGMSILEEGTICLY